MSTNITKDTAWNYLCGFDKSISKEEIVNEYFEAATIHGLSKIHVTKRIVYKLFWIAVFLVVFTFLVQAVVRLFNRVVSNEEKVTIETTIINADMPLPRITICSTVPYSANKTSIIKTAGFEKTPYQYYVDYFWKLKDTAKDGTTLPPFLDYSIFYCTFGEENCIQVLTYDTYTNWIDGKCFVFSGNASSQLKQSRPGSLSGLYLNIFINQEDFDADVPWAFNAAGIRIRLGGRSFVPFSDGIIIAPGEHTQIAIRKSIVKRLKAPYSDNCTDGKGIRLVTEGGYTLSACLLACFIFSQQAACGCVDPFSYSTAIRKQGLKAARNPVEINCTTMFAKRYIADQDICKCPPPCEEDKYEVTLSHSKWPSWNAVPSIVKSLRDSNPEKYSNVSTEMVERNVLALLVYYEDFSVQKTVKSPGYVWDNFAADLGGQMGLWMGASVFSIFELGSFLLALIHYLIYFRKEKAKSVATGRNVSSRVQAEDNPKIDAKKPVSNAIEDMYPKPV